MESRKKFLATVLFNLWREFELKRIHKPYTVHCTCIIIGVNRFNDISYDLTSIQARDSMHGNTDSTLGHTIPDSYDHGIKFIQPVSGEDVESLKCRDHFCKVSNVRDMCHHRSGGTEMMTLLDEKES